jgi:hypothetical protein
MSARTFRLFINYRRGDSGGYAGRIYDALNNHSPSWEVFMDIDTIEPGVDFTEVIDHELDTCDAVIAVMGRQWLQQTDVKGQRRLDHPDDFVRLELAAALDRPNVRVIPILVQGVDMPSSDDLPDVLVPLARRNAIELSDSRWSYDMSRLVDVLERIEQKLASEEQLPAGQAVLAPKRTPEASEPPDGGKSLRVATPPHEEDSRTRRRRELVPRSLPLGLTLAAIVLLALGVVVPYATAEGGSFSFLDVANAPWKLGVWYLFWPIGVALALVAVYGLVLSVKHPLGAGLLLGFGIDVVAGSLAFLGFLIAHPDLQPDMAPFVWLVGGLALVAAGGLQWRRTMGMGERSGVAAGSRVSSMLIVLVVSAAGLLVLATVVPVETGLRILGAFEPYRWYALEPFALALTFLFALRFINRQRSLVAGILIGGGTALVLSFVGHAVPPFFYEDPSPGLGGWLGIAGGALALGTGLALWRGKLVSPRRLT